MTTTDTDFDPTQFDSAAQPDIDGLRGKYGFVPNIAGVLGHSPEALRGYLDLSNHFDRCGLSFAERQVVLIAASVANGCEYCVAAHSAGAKMDATLHETVTALRTGESLADPRLEALRRLTAEMVQRRGWPRDETLARFHRAGFQKSQLLDVVLGVALKTLTNYTNHLAAPVLDPQFAGEKWLVEAKSEGDEC